MILTYKQTVARKYELVTLEAEEYIVAHNSKAFSKTLEIEIYKTSTHDITFGNNDADLIYELLEKATTPELVLDFCQKYGTLINANSPIIDGRYFRTNKIIEYNAETIDITYLTEKQKEYLAKPNIPLSGYNTLSPEHMNINHFYYYVHTLIMLDELYSETIASLSFSSAIELVKKIKNYCSYVEIMLSFEYSICDGLSSFLTAFPFYLYNIPKVKFINKNYDLTDTPTKFKEFFTDLSNIIKPANPDTKVSDSEKANSEEAEAGEANSEKANAKETDSEKADFVEADVEKADSEETNAREANSEKADTNDTELFVEKVKEIATQIYADIINFHIKDIPFSLLTSAKFDPLCDSFYTLGDAILFQKILNLTSSTRKIRCHDETCRKLFVPSNSTTKYCCSDCRKRHHTRESMRRKRAKNKNIPNQN